MSNVRKDCSQTNSIRENLLRTVKKSTKKLNFDIFIRFKVFKV